MFAAHIVRQEKHVAVLRLAPPDWSDTASILRYSELVDAADAQQAAADSARRNSRRRAGVRTSCPAAFAPAPPPAVHCRLELGPAHRQAPRALARRATRNRPAYPVIRRSSLPDSQRATTPPPRLPAYAHAAATAPRRRSASPSPRSSAVPCRSTHVPPPHRPQPRAADRLQRRTTADRSSIALRARCSRVRSLSRRDR